MIDNLCIIPARGGSQRIKRKNIKNFDGYPIITYPFQEACCSGLFGVNKVRVSSEDPEILAYVNEWSANVPFIRSNQTASNTATLVDVLNEIIEMYQELKHTPKNICLLLPTSVFTTKEDLIESYKYLEGSDSVVAITKYNHPIQRSFWMNAYDGRISMRYPEHEFTRTQDLGCSYHDAGQFYWINVESFLQQQKIFMNKTVGYAIDAIDIDTEDDWKLAELKYKLKRGYKI